MPRRSALLSVVVLLAACTGGADATRAVTSAGSNLLFFATPLGVTVFDAHEHRTTASVLGGILAPDRSAVFGASIDGDGTVLSRYDPESGAARRVASVDGSHELRVANHDGSMVVFGPSRQETGVEYPVGRAITTLTIAKANGDSHTLDVIGNVEPEAFSNDDTNLFVVQYLPPENPVGYQVRRLDLSTGELHNVRTDDRDLDKPMAGRARTQVLSPDGTHLYTLYVVAGDEASGTPGYAFVHVLDLVGKQAHCLDLPAPFGAAGAAAYAIAVSPDGLRLFVADPNMGVLSELDTRSLAVTRTVSIPVTHPPTAFAAVDGGAE